MISRLLTSHGITEAELSLTFVGRQRIRRLNREYLGRDRVTDVIAFNLSDREETPFVADIYVCVPQAEEQAATYGVPPVEELVRLAAHGSLHVLGYDHVSPGPTERMNTLQDKCVERFREGGFESDSGGPIFDKP